MSQLQRTLESMATLSAHADVWKPEVLPADAPDTLEILDRLLDADLLRIVHDTLPAQLRELMDESDASREDIPEEELEARVRAHLGERALVSYGTWVYYPWSLRVVHVLPEAEFAKLRSLRNRNKISEEEQKRLSELHIAIAGQSVGQAAALSLALEGVGGRLRLADFDAISLVNMNRLRAGVHDIGVNKAMLTARAIYEMNPYARLEVFTDGVTDENLEAFLDGIDILIEEADDLYMKVRLREAARARGIPVFMDTDDRGMLDIERFDLEPDRAILHGRLGGVEAESLRGLSTEDKVPYVFRIVGEDRISPRLAASLVEVGTTLKGFPQLASSVMLGAGITVDAIRRSALGLLNTSGRFYVDLEAIVAHDAEEGEAPATEAEAPAAPAGPSEPARAAPAKPAKPLAPKVRAGRGLAPDLVNELVAAGVMAPSGGNIQPWRFEAAGHRLRCIHDVERSRSFLDYRHRASYLALGAAVENIVLTAEQRGLSTSVSPFPEADDALVVCDLHFEPTREAPSDGLLFEQIPRRETNRRLGPRLPLEEKDAAALAEVVAMRGGRLHLVTDDVQLDEMGSLLGRGDRVRFLSRIMHQEMMSELRWTPEETERTRDGMDIETLELSPTDLAGMRLTSSWRVMDLVRRLGGGRGLEKPSRKSVKAASAVGLVTVPRRTPEDFFQGGRALERVWLMATALGYAFQPMTAIVYLFGRLEEGGEGLDEAEKRELTELYGRYRALLPVPDGSGEIMLFRLSRVGPASVRSLRRPIDDVLTFA